MTRKKYKRGQTVVIRKDLKLSSEYSGVPFVRYMSRYRGTHQIIESVDSCGYEMQGISGYVFSHAMIDHEETEKLQQRSDSGIIVPPPDEHAKTPTQNRMPLRFNHALFCKILKEIKGDNVHWSAVGLEMIGLDPNSSTTLEERVKAAQKMEEIIGTSRSRTLRKLEMCYTPTLEILMKICDWTKTPIQDFFY